MIPSSDRIGTMEHDANEAVPIQVIGAIMSGMVKQLRAGLKFRTVFFYHGIVNGKKYGEPFQGKRDTA